MTVSLTTNGPINVTTTLSNSSILALGGGKGEITTTKITRTTTTTNVNVKANSSSFSSSSSSSTSAASVLSSNPTMMALAMERPQSPGCSSGSERGDEITLHRKKTVSPLSSNNVTSNSTASAAVTTASTTALRRLHFKSGRSTKGRNTTAGTTAVTTTTTSVPKVVVMGSSSASTTETTINTSTESASTLVTNVTATDTSETCDSLDMGDNSGQSEPLLSSLDDAPHTTISIDSDQSATEMEMTTATVLSKHEMNLFDDLKDAESSLTISQPNKVPRTAPVISSVHFPFDPPASPRSVKMAEKHKDLFTFKDTDTYLELQKAKDEKNQYHPTNQEFVNKQNSSKENQMEKQQQNIQNSYNHLRRQSDDVINDERKFHQYHHRDFNWTEEDNKENKKRKELQYNKLNILKDEDGERSKSENNENIDGLDGSGKNKLLFHDEAKKQKRELRSKSNTRSNRYVNSMKISPKKERFTSSETSKRGRDNSVYTNNKAKNRINSAPAVTSKDKYFTSRRRSQDHQKHSATASYDKTNLTMFPFDREAIDYERIQRECFAVEEDPPFPYDSDSSSNNSESSDSDDNEISVRERKFSYSSPNKGSANTTTINIGTNQNDIFQQYTLLSQKETYHSYEKKSLKRNRPDLIHAKYDHITKEDAFTPKKSTDKLLSSNKNVTELHKFEQIASKFDQIPPKLITHEQHLHDFHHLKNYPPSSSSHQYHQYQQQQQQQQQQGSNNPSLAISNTSLLSGTGTNISNNTGTSSSYGNIISSGGTINSGNTGGSRGTPPLPDLRVDFFAETSLHNNQSHQQHQLPEEHSQETIILDECQQKPPQNAAGAINVTANPMETAVCTQPRATIVVQQPSLSLDNTVETVLLKNEGDFVSVEQVKESRKKKQQQREENMRQLLDVTNTLTFEELRDFEMRYGSPHHSRSQSVKTPGSRASGRPNQLSLPQQRSRVASMPNTGVEEEYYRLRHFSITGKGVVNRGDSLKSRRSRSNNSVASSNSSTEHLTANVVPVVGSAKTSATCSLASSRESSTSNPGNGPYRVLMLGSSAVGKSSLVSQFMTSEYLHAYDTSIDDESGEKSVSVLLSGEESELVFIDHTYTEMSPENCLSSYDPHGYCVIYSSADRSSFMVAERVLQALWTTENIAQKAVILVGNKADLARSRVISSDEGKAMATAYDCKFIETSVGINHNVDELLVGLLSQIRLKLENPEKSRDLFRKRSSRKSKRRACSPLGTACLSGNGGTNPSTPIGPTSLLSEIGTPPGSAHSSPRKYRGSRTSTSLKVKGILGRVWARDSKSKSCENLHVL